MSKHDHHEDDLKVQQLRLGILGGGQLAAMLCEAAFKRGLSVRVLSSSPQDPAAKEPGAVFSVGSLDDPHRPLHDFFRSVDVMMFENEFVDCDLLEEVARHAPGMEFFPQLDVIRTLQDKYKQKKLLERLEISTSPFIAYSDLSQPIESWLKDVETKLGADAVLKWSRHGYDGKGVLIGPKPLEERKRFCQAALNREGTVYAEKRIAFRNELAVVSVRDRSGKMEFYPLTYTRQRSGICMTAWGPAVSLGAPQVQEREAQTAARAIAESLNLHGVFAVEFFEDSTGALLVNEIAPRVHNTGHYSQDACVVSQFENHVRTALAHAVQPPQPAPGFAMINLLGPENTVVPPGKRILFPDTGPDLILHWYGKEEIRPGRKLGHVNGRVDSPAQTADLISRLEVYESAWANAVRDAAKAAT